MQGSFLTIAIDLMTMVLLAATIGYAAMLHRRLGEVRKGRHELSGLIAELSGAAIRAEAAIQGLKTAAGESHAKLEQQLQRAAGYRDELEIITASADKLAGRLEKAVGVARTVAPQPAIPAAVEHFLRDQPRVAAGLSRMERDLAEALKKAGSAGR